MLPNLRILFLIITLSGVCACMAQSDTIVRYMPSFKFNDGIYLTQEEFVTNCPSISKEDIYYDNGRQAEEIGMWRPVYTLVGDTLHLMFKVDVLSDLLMDDPGLYNDFNAITQKSKRKSRMYLFLRRYNDAHPVYFPITGCAEGVVH